MGERGGLAPVGAYLAGAAVLSAIGLVIAKQDRLAGEVLGAPEF